VAGKAAAGIPTSCASGSISLWMTSLMKNARGAEVSVTARCPGYLVSTANWRHPACNFRCVWPRSRWR